MQNVISVELKRDCEVVQIPAGNVTTLPAGTAVDITQTLGGTYTIHGPGGLFRIAAKDADALGLDRAAPENEPRPVHEGEAGEDQIWETLRSCFDPEIPVNIVDLGLVYEMQLNRLPNGHGSVLVKMTLTAPGCGMGGVIARDAEQKLRGIPGIEEAVVEIVWDPPWHHSMITESGKKVLGMD